MAEIEFILPTVQYGNVHVKGTPEEFGLSDIAAPYEIGRAYAIYFNLVMQGFAEGSQVDVSGPQVPPVGARVTVGGTTFTKVSNDPFPPVTEPLTEDEDVQAANLVKSELGATEVDPWDAPITPKAPEWEAPAGFDFN